MRHNGHLFTGTNSLILCLAADKAGYRSRYWLTRAQGERLGGKIPDGEVGARVLRPGDRPAAIGGDGSQTRFRFNRGLAVSGRTREGGRIRVRMDGYHVFNAEQFRGLPDRFYAAPETPMPDPWKPRITSSVPSMPGWRWAEIAPAIPHPRTSSKCRDRSGFVGKQSTSRASPTNSATGLDMGRALAGASLASSAIRNTRRKNSWPSWPQPTCWLLTSLPGIRRQSHAAYLSSWLEILENDPEAFPRAATLAQSAADYMTISAAAPCVDALEDRPLDDRDYHVIYFDRVEVGPNPMLVAIGLDTVGLKFLLGVRPAAAKEDDGIEEAQTLLRSLVDRGLPPNQPRLFVTSDVATLRKALQADFARPSFIQRCRATVVREVASQLPREDRTDGTSGDAGRPDGKGSTQLTRATVRERIRDAYDLGTIAGVFPLSRLAHQLEGEGAGESAKTLRESLNGLFTIARLGLEPPLSRTLSTTNVITQARSGLRHQICRPPTWEDERMALQWSIASFWKTVEGRRRIAGFSQLRGLVARMAARAGTYPWPSNSRKKGS